MVVTAYPSSSWNDTERSARIRRIPFACRPSGTLILTSAFITGTYSCLISPASASLNPVVNP